jgi:hypothetical protein
MSYLHRRVGGVYYTRMVVPPRLKPIIGKTDLGRSLRTKDRADALRLLPEWLAEAQATIAAAELELARSLSPAPRVAPYAQLSSPNLQPSNIAVEPPRTGLYQFVHWQAGLALYGALPNHSNPPACSRQRRDGTRINYPVALNLRPPKLGSSGGQLEQVTIVTVPKAAVREQGSFVTREHQVWLAGKFPHMKAEPEARPVKGASQNKFGLGVLPFDARHHPASHASRNNVSHLPPCAPARAVRSWEHRPQS